MFLLTNDEMKVVEQCAIKSYEIPGILLMEHAGYSVVETVVANFDKKADILIVCGRGNNGGDGFVACRKLLLEGYSVKIIIIGNSSTIKGDALINLTILNHMCEDILCVKTLEEVNDTSMLFLDADVIVDAIFGTGLNSSIRDLEEGVIEMINEAKAKVVSVDIPSGINGSTSKVMGCAVRADITVAFDSPKCGNMLYPGVEYNGNLKVVKIGIPEACYDQIESKQRLITKELAKTMLPSRKKNSHKGTFGKASIIAGSFGMEGAAILSCSAAMRTGLGLLKLFVPKSINNIVKIAVPEIVTVPLDEVNEGVFSVDSVNTILEGIELSTSVAIGSGCGMYDGVGETVRSLIAETDIPLIIDADGLNLLAKDMKWLDQCSKDIVLTPHIGEMARLTDLSKEEIIDNPVNIAREYAKQWGVTLVLKSARTVVASPTGELFINCNGNSGMATAGSGDVLTGIIAGLVAQGMSVMDASVLGVYIHGDSGDRMAAEIGEHGIVAGDIVKQIAFAMKELTN